MRGSNETSAHVGSACGGPRQQFFILLGAWTEVVTIDLDDPGEPDVLGDPGPVAAGYVGVVSADHHCRLTPDVGDVETPEG
jgi:hypothetical protein